MRLGLIALLAVAAAVLVMSGLRAEPFHGTETFDQEQAAHIAAVALAFMAPRILDPVPPSQLTVWGLRGLTTLDARLLTQWTGAALRLTRRDPTGNVLLRQLPAPPAQDAVAWGEVAGTMLRSGWDASRNVRAVGAGEVISSFFDELFNHLDPYSRYLSPLDAAAERAAREGKAGVGMTVAAQGSRLVVRDVAPDGPAATAGIRRGDILVGIDGEPAGDEDPASAGDALAGDEDTDVSVEIRHDGHRRALTLRRAQITPQTVRASREGSLLVLRISAFAGDTGMRLQRALAGAVRGPVRGVVIDLRGNRGGVLTQAVSSADALLTGGIVAVTAGRDPEANHTFVAEGSDLAHGLPVVVLVDGQSASAAEILAAALADQHRAVVVGSSTVGKGLVQTIDDLPDGGSLFITWSRVLAPLSWPIQGLGVLPQVCTSFGQDAAMRQLRALADGDQPMRAALDRHRASRAPVPAAEALEIRQACPAAEGRDADLEAARFLIAHPRAYEAALLGPAPPAVPLPADPPDGTAALTHAASARR